MMRKSTSKNAAKKSKTFSETEEIDSLVQYLLQYPSQKHSQASRILQVALTALEQERKRIERDDKLQRKFSSESNTSPDEVALSTKSPEDVTRSTPVSTPDSEVVVSMTTHHEDDFNDDELMEWQDIVPADQMESPDNISDGSLLGRHLAQAAISSISRVEVSSPLGALALILHAALCSNSLGFACTGIPESQNSNNGFAPPIRELPKSQLVPVDWEQHATYRDNDDDNGIDSFPHVTFRYRKAGVGAVLLRVVLQRDTDHTVQVELTPSRSANSKEPAPTVLTFALQDHVNLDSLSKALSSSSSRTGSMTKTLPALHYKSLPILLTKFCNTFDLGPVRENTQHDMETTEQGASSVLDEQQQRSFSSSMPYVDSTIVTGPPAADPLRIPSRARPYEPHSGTDHSDEGDGTPTIQVFHPPGRHRGDFDSDLIPSGMIDPNSLSGMGGSLMGPNHPAFGSHPARPDLGGGAGSGFGMRPRFDPIGPPGGPTDVQPPNGDPKNGGKPRGRRPGGLGDPNPDHHRPPSDLGNNMFL